VWHQDIRISQLRAVITLEFGKNPDAVATKMSETIMTIIAITSIIETIRTVRLALKQRQ